MSAFYVSDLVTPGWSANEKGMPSNFQVSPLDGFTFHFSILLKLL